MIKLCLVSKMKHQQEAAIVRWFDLPEPVEKIRAALHVTEDDELLILDYEAPFKIDGQMRLEQLNYYAERLETLPQHLIDDMKDLMSDGYESIEDILAIPDRYTFVETVTTDKCLGDYLVDEDVWHTIPSAVKPYIDTRLYGQDYRISSDVIYTHSGAYIR